MQFRLILSGLLLFGLSSPVLAAGGAGSMNPLKPVMGTLVWTAVTFVLLLFILRRYAWGPLLGALDERQRTIEGDIEQAKSDREEAQKLLEEHKSLVVQARRERAEALSVGQQEGERLKTEILDQARQEREQLIKQTEEQVAAGIRQARDDLRATTAGLAINAAEKLLGKALDDASHRKLVEDHLAQLERS